MSVTFSSCGDDKDLVGKWETSNSEGAWYIWEFKTDGSFIMAVDYRGDGMIFKGEYSAIKNILRIDFNIIEDGEALGFYNGTYNISGGKLTYTVSVYESDGERYDEPETIVFKRVR